MTSDCFDSGAAFVGSLMRQHGLSNYVANGEDRRIVSLQLLIYSDETTLTELNLCFVEAGNFGIGFAADRHKNSVENFSAFFNVGAFEGSANSAPLFPQRRYGRVYQNGFEQLFQTLV